MVIVLMGPAGAGKTTVGKALAADLGWTFVDGDDYHSPANVSRMQSGVGLSDSERDAWLRDLHALIAQSMGRRDQMVLACSALKAGYRDVLRGDLRPVRFVYLKAPRPVLESRLELRPRHFAGPALLHSQLLDFEDPGETAVTVDATRELDVLVPEIRRELGLL